MIRKQLSAISSITFLLTLFFMLNTGCAGKTRVKTSVPQTPPGFDQALAEKWGADEYGMKKYVMALLKAGPNRSQDAETRAKLQRAHLDNITRLAEEGKLILAGPFLDNGEIRGIYLFNVETVGEAEQLTRTDPAIQAGTLIMELHPWYGSAALMEVNERHTRIAKKKI
jgi:uncharacterized protein YciI